MLLWPEALPKPSLDFNVNNDTSVARTKMDSGRFRQRRRFTRAFRQMRATWKLTDAQFGYFQSIYHHLVDDGADWFQAYLPMGNGMELRTVRFVADTYGAKYDDVMHWNVSVNMETEQETAPQGADEIAALVAVDFDIAGMEAASYSLDRYLNVTLYSQQF